MRLRDLQTPLRGRKGTASLQAAFVMTTLAAMAGVAAPSVERYLSHAQVLQAKSEVRVIGLALHLFLFDLGTTGTITSPRTHDRVELLVSEGATPLASGQETLAWTPPGSGPAVARLDDLLLTNALGFEAKENATQPFGWDGPYLNSCVGPDPWGNRYAVSIGLLAQGQHCVPVVISAGPDGIISVPHGLRIEQMGQTFGDDIYFVLR